VFFSLLGALEHCIFGFIIFWYVVVVVGLLVYVFCVFSFSFNIFSSKILNSWNGNSCLTWCIHIIYVVNGSVVLSLFLSVSCRGVSYINVSGWIYAMT
jgi:hypothetical protein